MTMLQRPGYALHMETVDLVPPWNAPGEAVLFCHGVAVDCDIWSGWLPGLIDRFRVARFDLCGFGRSTLPGPDHRWSFDGLADDILAVADAAGFERFHLVGESLGGTACLFTAAREPERIASVCACSTGHYGPAIQNVAAWRAAVEADGMERWSEEMVPRRFADGKVGAAERQWMHEVQSRTAASSLLDAADLLMGAELTDTFRRIACPVLLLHPDSSPFLPMTVAATCSRCCPTPASRSSPAPGTASRSVTHRKAPGHSGTSPPPERRLKSAPLPPRRGPRDRGCRLARRLVT